MNSIACLLETAAKRWPQNIVLEDNDGEMTYAELHRQSRRAATFFLKKGLKRGQPVAVYLPKSNACVVSFYAALYCGVPYSPLDFTAPAARIQRTLEGTSFFQGINTLITNMPWCIKIRLTHTKRNGIFHLTYNIKKLTDSRWL